MRTLQTWAGGSRFGYAGSVQEGVIINYGKKLNFSQRIRDDQFGDLVEHFRGRTVNIGTSRTSPPHGSVGEWLQENVTKTAMASYVGPILIQEGYATRIGGPIIQFK